MTCFLSFPPLSSIINPLVLERCSSAAGGVAGGGVSGGLWCYTNSGGVMGGQQNNLSDSTITLRRNTYQKATPDPGEWCYLGLNWTLIVSVARTTLINGQVFCQRSTRLALKFKCKMMMVLSLYSS